MVLLCLALVGCTSRLPDSDQLPAYVGEPQLTVGADSDTPLVGVLTLETDIPTSIQVEATADGDTWTAGIGAAADTTHDITILGWLPGADHVLTVTATASDGASAVVELEVVAPALPADLPSIDVLVATPDRMEPGFTLFPVWPLENEGLAWFAVIVDEQGRVRWLHRASSLISVTLTPARTLRFVRDRATLVEMDLRGHTIRSWSGTSAIDPPQDTLPLATLSTHHFAMELPNGNLVAFGSEVREVDGYPISASDLEPRTSSDVMGDVIVEFEPETGDIVRQVALLDVLDPRRIGYNGAASGPSWWDTWIGADVSDWSHGNALSYDEETDTLTASLRHQDAVVALRWSDATLQWIAAPDANWNSDLRPYVLRPAGRDEGPAYHQHGAKLTSEGDLLLFDNGNGRASAGEQPVPSWQVDSRALDWSIDPMARTRTLEWTWTLPEPNFADSLGDVDRLPETGNMLLTWGSVPETGAAEVVEVTRESGDEVVLRLRVPSARVYGADRIPSIVDLVAAGIEGGP